MTEKKRDPAVERLRRLMGSGPMPMHPEPDEDPGLVTLRRYGIPVTRENYLSLAFGDPVPELSAEQEADLPPELQDWSRFKAPQQDNPEA